jgi:hypothetical protein
VKNPRLILAAALAAGNIAAFNDQTQLYPEWDGNAGLAHGTVACFNDANFDAQYLNQPLNEYIVGAPEDEGIQATLDALFPPTIVGRAFSYRTHDTSEQFQDDADNDGDIREIGGDFAEIRRTGNQVDGRTDNKGLIMVLDNDQGGEDSQVQQAAVVNLRTRLFRSDLRRGLALIDTAASNTAKNWGPSATGPDPDTDVLDMVDSGGDDRGVDSNIVVFGKSARIKRIKCLRTKTNPDEVGSQLSLQQMADFYGVNSVQVVNSRRQSGKTTKAKILGDVVYSYFVNPTAMKDDATNFKRFVSPTPSGILRVYVMPKLKKTIVAVEHYSRLVQTSALGVKKLTITYT